MKLHYQLHLSVVIFGIMILIVIAILFLVIMKTKTISLYMKEFLKKVLKYEMIYV